MKNKKYELMKLKGTSVESAMWHVGFIYEIEQAEIESQLGLPHVIESDSSRTFGGEELWWGYEIDKAIVLLRFCVSYKEIHIHSNIRNKKILFEIVSSFNISNNIEIFDVYYPTNQKARDTKC